MYIDPSKISSTTKEKGVHNYGFSTDDKNLYGQEASRPVLTTKYLENTYQYDTYNSDNILKSSFNYVKKYYKPSSNCCKSYLQRRLPVIEWLPKYDFKQNLVKDLIGGLTVGIIQVPQSMAYSLTAGLPVANGLYVTFFQCLIYFLLGTSRHISPGTYAIISLMVFTSTNKYAGELFPKQHNVTHHILPDDDVSLGNMYSDSRMNAQYPNHLNRMPEQETNQFISKDPLVARVMISTVLSLTSGIILFIGSILHLGVLTKYISDSVVGGLSVGACFHVIMSQLKYVFGIHLEPVTIPFILIGTAIEIGKNIATTNTSVLVIAIISFIILFTGKLINDKFCEKFPVPLPVEIIVVIVATIISYFAAFETAWHVQVVGKIPIGFPTPKFPPMNLFIKLFGDSVNIAILTFGLNISFSKLFAKKYNYKISPNQEFSAYGLSNIIGSFFNGYPGCVGISRCFIGDGIGVKTQVVAFVNTIIMLIVILAVGPFLASLPNCVLASLIIAALIQKTLHVKDFWTLFKKSKIEGIAWLFTFLSVMIFDVDIGLYIGLTSNLLLVVIKTQRAGSSLLGNIPGTNIFECIETCKEAKEYKYIKIIRYEESVNYTNVDNFKYKVVKLAGVDPEVVQDNIERECRQLNKKLEKVAWEQDKCLKKKIPTDHINFLDYAFDQNGLVDINENTSRIYEKVHTQQIKNIFIKDIILDCSCINYIDSQGIEAIQWLYENYKKIGISIHLSYCKLAVQNSFKKTGMDEKLDFDFIFSTTFEAVLYIFKKNYPSHEILLDIKQTEVTKKPILDEANYPNSLYKTYEKKEAISKKKIIEKRITQI